MSRREGTSSRATGVESGTSDSPETQRYPWGAVNVASIELIFELECRMIGQGTLDVVVNHGTIREDATSGTEERRLTHRFGFGERVVRETDGLLQGERDHALGAKDRSGQGPSKLLDGRQSILGHKRRQVPRKRKEEDKGRTI